MFNRTCHPLPPTRAATPPELQLKIYHEELWEIYPKFAAPPGPTLTWWKTLLTPVFCNFMRYDGPNIVCNPDICRTMSFTTLERAHFGILAHFVVTLTDVPPIFPCASHLVPNVRSWTIRCFVFSSPILNEETCRPIILRACPTRNTMPPPAGLSSVTFFLSSSLNCSEL